MVNLAQLMALLPSGSVGAPQPHDATLTPEANAMTGAVKPKPAPAAAPKFQRPAGLRNTVGIIADVLAAMGGKEMGYSGTLKSMESSFNEQQKLERAERTRGLFSQFLVDPTEENQNAFAMADPQLYADYEKERRVKAASPGSMSDPQAFVAALVRSGVPEIEAWDRVNAERARYQPTTNGYAAGADLAGAMPPPREFAPQQPRTEIRSSGDGNDYLYDLNTGNRLRNLGPSVVKTGGGGREKPLTESEGKTTGYYGRATQAEKILSNPRIATNPGVGARVAQELPLGVGSYVISPRDQQTLNARDTFLTAILRKDSGATITAEERKTYGGIFFPSPGDSPETVRQKAATRKQAIEGLRVGSGRGAGSVSGPSSGTTVTAGGKTYSFPNQQAADAFKKRAGL